MPLRTLFAYAGAAAAALCATAPAPAAVPVVDRPATAELRETVASLAEQIAQLETIIEALELLNALIGLEDPTEEFKTDLEAALEEAADPLAIIVATYVETLSAIPGEEGEMPLEREFETLEDARAYALELLFVPSDPEATAREMMTHAAITQRRRMNLMRVTAVNAWSFGAAVHNPIAEANKRHGAIASALENAVSLREELSALTAATLESIDSRIATNAIAATMLELQALEALVSSPPALDPLTEQALQGAP